MKREKQILVKCPECRKAYYVKERNLEIKTACSYCGNRVVLINPNQ